MAAKKKRPAKRSTKSGAMRGSKERVEVRVRRVEEVAVKLIEASRRHDDDIKAATALLEEIVAAMNGASTLTGRLVGVLEAHERLIEKLTSQVAANATPAESRALNATLATTKKETAALAQAAKNQGAYLKKLAAIAPPLAKAAATIISIFYK